LWLEYEWQVQNGVISRRAVVHGANKRESYSADNPDKDFYKECVLYTSSWHNKESQCRDEIIKNYHGIEQLDRSEIVHLRSTEISANSVFPFHMTPREKNIVTETTQQMEDALGIDPAKVVVVCITGYQFSSLNEYQKQEAIAETKARMKMQLRGRELSTDFDYDMAAEKMLKELSSKTGMENLRNEFVQRLRPFGVPPSNIIHSDWTEHDKGNPYKQPKYTNLVARINAINPTYLAIFGHSYGGCTATRVSNVTTKIPDFIGLVDCIFVPFTTESAPQASNKLNYPRGHKIYNWYQHHYPVKGYAHPLDSNRKHVNDINLNDKVSGHTTIDDYPPLHRQALDIVSSAISLASTEKMKNDLVSPTSFLEAKL